MSRKEGEVPGKATSVFLGPPFPYSTSKLKNCPGQGGGERSSQLQEQRCEERVVNRVAGSNEGTALEEAAQAWWLERMRRKLTPWQ